MAGVLKAGRGLELRPLNLRDAKALFALVEANRERLRRWLPWPDANRCVLDSRAYILRVRAHARAGVGQSFGLCWKGALVGLADVQGGEVKDGGFLGDGSAVGEDHKGLFLELHVVEIAEGLDKLHPGIRGETAGFEPLSRPWMGGDDDPLPVRFREVIQEGDELGKVNVRIDVLLPVAADEVVVLGRQVQALEDVRSRDAIAVVMEHLEHGAAGLDDAVRRDTFPQEVLPGVPAVGHVYVRQVIHHLAVGFLGNPLIEAAVARFHVEDWDLAPLGGDDRKAAVSVAEHQ